METHENTLRNYSNSTHNAEVGDSFCQLTLVLWNLPYNDVVLDKYRNKNLAHTNKSG